MNIHRSVAILESKKIEGKAFNYEMILEDVNWDIEKKVGKRKKTVGCRHINQ